MQTNKLNRNFLRIKIRKTKIDKKNDIYYVNDSQYGSFQFKCNLSSILECGFCYEKLNDSLYVVYLHFMEKHAFFIECDSNLLNIEHGKFIWNFICVKKVSESFKVNNLDFIIWVFDNIFDGKNMPDENLFNQVANMLLYKLSEMLSTANKCLQNVDLFANHTYVFEGEHYDIRVINNSVYFMHSNKNKHLNF